ncbi:MAG: DNA mismatch repair protein MutS, partial [Deltaproteobacteria bacterium]|nr:DNA mismatch repair protein MutS [Deltaproteobacteria bacterium]
VLGADEKAKAIEHMLFVELRQMVAGHIQRIQAQANVLSTLDALCSFAHAAHMYNYTRPEVNDSDVIMIKEGRHPVVEAGAMDGFVPNDILLDSRSNQIIVLTGPNMAGKSTFMRQIALIVLMAQAGSFVPSSSAAIGRADRIFTRIGASDDLYRGQSTFMVEMNETANILNNATPRSLVILDEIGRGTSTFDGLSIAWSVAEYLHDQVSIRAKTLFATHYHELTELSLTKERVKNYNMSVKEFDGRIVFLRKVVPGGASRSYGIQVARLAGLPHRVTERAGEILKNLEKSELDDKGSPRLATGKNEPQREPLLQNLFAEKDPLHDYISVLDPDSMSPLDALKALYKIKKISGD